MEPADQFHEPFQFFTEYRLIALTGLRASNLIQLLEHLYAVPGSSFFFHTHFQLMSYHFQKPTFYNDFALWVSEALQEERLAERLTAIDILAFTSVRQIRNAIIAVIEDYLKEQKWHMRECSLGDEFHFCRAKSIVMAAGLEASDPADFFVKFRQITPLSLFYHFFEARLRLERATNDFSHWMSRWGETKLAAAIDRLDPYSMNIQELKERILSLFPQGG